MLELIAPKEAGLESFVALVGHPLVVLLETSKEEVKIKLKNDEIVYGVDIPVYKNPVRIDYKIESVEDSDGIINSVEAINLRNLPKQISGLNYIVSRRVLEFVTKENDKLKQKKKFLEWAEATTDPVLKEKLQEEAQNLNCLFDKPRDDFYAPGEQIKTEGGKTLGALGLLKEVR